MRIDETMFKAVSRFKPYHFTTFLGLFIVSEVLSVYALQLKAQTNFSEHCHRWFMLSLNVKFPMEFYPIKLVVKTIAMGACYFYYKLSSLTLVIRYTCNWGDSCRLARLVLLERQWLAIWWKKRCVLRRWRLWVEVLRVGFAVAMMLGSLIGGYYGVDKLFSSSIFICISNRDFVYLCSRSS